ncbi:MAG: haloacid dehalogenase [Deltaproteobacteria bacterium]|nr:haloacid dehalogenase [Deltaproteobacteria bacterium]
MWGMNSSDRFFLDAFRDNFGKYEEDGIPIALYGIGEKTKLIIENIKKYNIVGLMDQNSVGKTIYGRPVLSNDEVFEKVKAIIIVANMSVAETIYRRIAFLKKEQGIGIFFINGTAPREIDEMILNDSYWEKTKAGLLQTIEENDVISFDLFDTLIMRQMLLPADVFDLVERELAQKHGMAIDFKNKRIEAERHTFREIDKYCTIHKIYRTLKDMLDLNDQQERMIKNLEIKIELSCCQPRTSMVDCYRYARSRGKRVVITTDTFLTREFIESILDRCGIEVPERLLISCEERKLKYNGALFHYLRELYGGKTILHIGDNHHVDNEMARNAGLGTYEIRSAYDIATASALGHLLTLLKSIEDRKVMGRLASRYLNDPFALNEHRGRLPIESPFDVGYLSFGPLVFNYLIWLIQKSGETKVDRLLFFARDGFILERLYRRLIKASGISAPECIYFLTSRRAASVAGIKSEKDIAFIVNNICKIKKIKIGHLLSKAFGVPACPGDPLKDLYFYDVNEDALIRHLNRHYREAILENAKQEREQYLAYIKSLGIRPGEIVGCVNFIGRGITQYFMSEIMEKTLYGFYFATEHDMTDVFDSPDAIFALYGKRLSPFTSRSSLLTKALFGEVVFSAPDEQLVKFDGGGKPVFQRKRKSRDFSMIGECHRGIEQFVEEMIELNGNDPWPRNNTEFLDNLFGLFSSPACVCSDQVKKSFVFSDYYNPDVPEAALSLN